MHDLSGALIRHYLRRKVPILTGLSATYLFRMPREYGPKDDYDDVRGLPAGHFVVLCGYDHQTRDVLIADPLWPNPLATDHYYVQGVDRVLSAIMLGIVTYDANLLIVRPRGPRVEPLTPRRRDRRPVPTLIVTDDAKDWPSELPEAEVVDSWSYLTGPRYASLKGVRLFNLCKSYNYQNAGYYVSLLAEARGHRPLPSIQTIQDMKSPAMVRLFGGDLDELIQKDLHPLQSDAFTLSIYFGRNVAKRYDPLSRHLFDAFRAPMLRAQFRRVEGRWQLRGVAAIGASEVPEAHWPFVADAAREFFAGRRASVRRRATYRYDLAILRNPDEGEPPSDEKALQKFTKAGEAVGLAVELIGPDDYGRIAEFDALFIRETTAPNHHTYRFARRAAGEGLVVIDDPESIVRCSNKVYLAELLSHHHIPPRRRWSPTRRTSARSSRSSACPASSSSRTAPSPEASSRSRRAEQLRAELERFWHESDLVVAQEFLPTTFDWRIGILDGQPLFACKYYMARKHWQIIKRDAQGNKPLRQVRDAAGRGRPPQGRADRRPRRRADRRRPLRRRRQAVGRPVLRDRGQRQPEHRRRHRGRRAPRRALPTARRVFLRRIERRKLGYGGGNNRG